MSKKKTSILHRLASLKLALACLIGLLIVTFFGTLNQVNHGIYLTQKQFFQSVFIMWEPAMGIKLPIFPGGFLLGTLMIISISAAMITQRLISRKKIGLFIVHSGLILLLLGGGLTSCVGVESQLAIKEGETKQYSESVREVELVVLRSASPNTDRVVAIPHKILEKKSTITHEELPFEIEINHYYPNAALMREKNTLGVTHGVGTELMLRQIPLEVDIR